MPKYTITLDRGHQLIWRILQNGERIGELLKDDKGWQLIGRDMAERFGLDLNAIYTFDTPQEMAAFLTEQANEPR